MNSLIIWFCELTGLGFSFRTGVEQRLDQLKHEQDQIAQDIRLIKQRTDRLDGLVRGMRAPTPAEWNRSRRTG
jgi:hypothetical protein